MGNLKKKRRKKIAKHKRKRQLKLVRHKKKYSLGYASCARFRLSSSCDRLELGVCFFPRTEFFTPRPGVNPKA